MSRLMLDRELAAVIIQAFAHSVWQGLIIAALGWLIGSWLGRRSAQLRYLVLVIALALIPLCIPITAIYLVNAARATEAARLSYLVNTPLGELPGSREQSSNIQPNAGMRPPRAAAPAAIGWRGGSIWEANAPTALFLYFAMVVIMLFRLVRSVRGGQSLAANSSPLVDEGVLSALGRAGKRMGFSYTPAVALCSAISMPAVIGLIQPIVLIPVAVISGMEMTQIECVIMHELAHIRRHDQFIYLLQRIIEAVLFFNPAIWWLSSRIKIVREWCCDDLAVNAGAPRYQYAEALLQAGEIEMHSRFGAVPAPMLQAATGDGSDIRRRIVRLIGDGHRSPIRLTSRPTATLSATFAVALILPVLLLVRVLPASLSPQQRDAEFLSELKSIDVTSINLDNQPALRRWSMLHRAVVYGSVREVRMLLKNHANPDARIPGGWHPLHFAACLGRTDVASLLLDAGAKVDSVNDDGRTPLHVAIGGARPFLFSVSASRNAMVRLLLNAHADPNLPDNIGRRALHVAATSADNLSILSDLADAGAQLDAPARIGQTALHLACERADAPMIRELLRLGARADLLDQRGMSALNIFGFAFAASNQSVLAAPPEIADELIRHRASLDLTSAACLGFDDFVRDELDRNPSLVNAPLKLTRFGNNLLHWAVIAGNSHLVQLLVDRGADVNYRDRSGKRSVLQIAVSQNVPRANVVRVLLSAGADVNAADIFGNRPLHLAVLRRQRECVGMLLSRGADPTVVNKTGQRPLDGLTSDDVLLKLEPDAELTIAQAFIDHHVNLNQPGVDGMTALHRAVLFGRVALAGALLKGGADPNLQDSNHRTPLMLAKSLKSVDPQMMQLLQAHGADPNQSDGQADPAGPSVKQP